MLFQKLRKNTRGILIVIAIAFGASLFYTGAMAIMDRQRGKQELAANSIALVNGEPISWAAYQENVYANLRYQEMMGARVNPLMVEAVKYNTVESLISQSLLLQEAKKQKIKVSRKEIDAKLSAIKESFPSAKEFQEQLRGSGLTEAQLRGYLKEQIQVEKLLDDLRNEVRITEEEIVKAYEEVRPAHILVIPEDDTPEAKEQARQKVQELAEQLRQGADFAELARAYSEDVGSKEEGGDLGFVGRGRLVKEFEEAAFALEVGEISDVVETDYGFHVIKLLDRKLAEGDEFLEARDALAAELKEQKVNNKIAEFVAELRDDSQVVIRDEQIIAHGLMREGNVDAAVEHYKAALEGRPDDAYLRASLAQAYLEQDKTQEAIQELEQAVAQADSDSQLHLMLGLAYLQADEEDKGVESLLRASEKSASDFLMQIQISSILQRMGREEASVVEDRIAEIQRLYEEQLKALQEAEENQAEEETPEGSTAP
jgi:parvulin-like peptidyl-prolyl isomerase